MRPLRNAAAGMAERGDIEATQHGLPVDTHEARGPMRVRLQRDWIG